MKGYGVVPQAVLWRVLREAVLLPRHDVLLLEEKVSGSIAAAQQLAQVEKVVDD